MNFEFRKFQFSCIFSILNLKRQEIFNLLSSLFRQTTRRDFLLPVGTDLMTSDFACRSKQRRFFFSVKEIDIKSWLENLIA